MDVWVERMGRACGEKDKARITLKVTFI